MTSPRSIRLFTALLALLSTASLAQTGVGDDRVSLPDGPGSRDGLGDNASVNPNMGQMSTSVPIEVPGGFEGITPSVGLSYSSGAGNSVVGLGWSMGMPFIERMTSRGYPDYDADDRFVANGSEQLVRVSSTATTAVYRARFEGGFVRYTWVERGGGDEGYWTAEYPDGLVATFGATSDGSPVLEARVGTSGSAGERRGVFRYLLTSMVDRFGHETIYDYQVYGTTSLLDQISYVFTNGTPRYRIGFEYEERQDIQSDARGGFLEEISDRLSAVDVFSGNTRISRYVLDYEAYAAAGGPSRLQRVQRFGKDGGLFPVVQSFEYSKALGGVCDDSDGRNCRAPYLVDMGALGVNLQSRTANLIDINGDSLPDIVDTQNAGQPMRIFLNELHADGSQEFGDPANSAVLADSSGFALDSAKVQMLDVNGDGFVDLVSQLLGKFLVNRGAGDWDSLQSLTATAVETVPGFGEFNAAQDGDLANIRFLDADGDRRIDVLRTQVDGTEISLNNGDGSYRVLDGVMPMGDDGSGNTWDFASTSNLELADMNGDGLLDPVRILSGGLQYQLNLGFGQWSAIQTISNLPFTEQNDVDALELEDINGDGVDDIVVVLGSTVRFAINRNGATFDAVTTIAGVGNQSLPERLATTTVLYADMNGNGSNDIVWITGAGNVTFLELFPVRPNLLTKIENGLGLVTEVTYGTAAEQRAQATDPATQWPDPIPTQMIVVLSMETYAQSSDPTAVQHQVTRYDYQAGFYDGDEKQFRGFSHVEKTSDGDDYGLTSHQVMTYDTGAGDDRAQMAGLLLHETADDDDGPQSDATSNWGLCPVSDIPASGLDFPIRFVCKISDEIVHQEGAPASQWVTTRAEYEYDGSGNQTTSANLGVTKVGGGGCAPCQRDAAVFGQPCGPQCVGDEAYDETDFIAPPKVRGAWMLNLEREQRSYGRPGSDVVATSRTFYDGVSFVGLGQDASDPVHASLGLVTRTAIQRVVGAPFETVIRNAYDDDGNVSDTVAARGDIDGEAFHTRYTYDSDHLEVESETKGIASAAGDYSLKRVYEYDALFGGVARATAWFIVGEPPPADSSELWSYDQFGRLEKNAAAGDTLAAPSSTYTYEYGNPVTRIVSRNSVTSGGTLELERIECLDGFGRELQSATKVADDTYLVQGAQRLNRNGLPNRVFEAFTTDGARACDAPAASVVFDELFYDSTGRERRVVRGDGPERGGVASLVERRFGPLETTVLDEDDNDADSPTRDTPLVLRSDGLGRTVTVERLLDRDGASQVYTITYDELGNMRGRVDPAGNETVQTWDLSGRLLSISDPDRGTTTLSYDADDNPVRVVDANGTVTVRQYDALDRMTAEFDEADEAGTRVDSYYDRHPVCLPSTCTNAAGKFVGSRYPLGALGEGLDSLGYDARESLTYRSRQLGQARFEFSTSYDNAGRVVRESYPGDVQLEYRYDVASRVVEIPGSIDLVTYDDQGRFQEIQYANGLVDSRRYGRLGELVHVDTSGRNDDPLVSLDYSYNRQRDLRQIVDASAGAPGFLDASFGYDALRRLSSAGVGRQAAAGFEQQGYQYDLLDNIVAKTSSLASDSSEHVGALAYGPEHPRAVTTSGATAIAYDPAGRTISRGRQTFEYDFRARLRTVAQDNAPLARYFYATAQSRVLSVVGGHTTWELAPDLEVRDGVLRLRFGAGADATIEVQSDAVMAQVFPTAAADGVVNAADAFATGLAGADDDANAVLAGSARRLLLGPTGRQTSWMVVDHQGSTVAVADGQGAVTERIAYQPFGAVRASTAGRTEYASFTGRDLDNETGFIDFAARSYSPTEGRFLTPDDAFSRFSEDHITEMTDATGSYSYCSDNPANFVDPTGNQSEWATARIGALIGGRTVIRGQMAKEVFFFKLNLIKGADLVLESYQAVQKSARRAGGMFRAAIDKRKEAAAKRQVSIAASPSKGVDPAGAVATSASASLGQGQTVKGDSQPKGRFARFEAALGAIARNGANIGIEQKLRAHFRKRQMKAKTKAGRRAEQAHWVKANPRLAAQKGAGSGTRPRR